MRVFLRVIVLRDARAGADLARIEAREAAIAFELVDGEIHRAVVRLVGGSVRLEAFHEVDHLRNECGRAWIVLGALNAEELAIGVEGLADGIGELGDGDGPLRRPLDDFVVDVGQVHHLFDGPSTHVERATEEVFKQKGPKIAEVRRIVDRRPARVERDLRAVGRGEGFYAAGQRVVKSKLGHIFKLTTRQVGGRLGAWDEVDRPLGHPPPRPLVTIEQP